MNNQDSKARQRAEIIVAVRCGQITAKEGARRLGVSRKTYYEWEKRGLDAMLAALCDRSAGRPASPVDPRVEALQERLVQLEEQVRTATQSAEIRASLATLFGAPRKARRKKNASSSPKS